MEDLKNEIAKVSDTGCFLVEGSSKASYSSIAPKTIEEKKAFFNAVNSPVRSLRECINMTINLKHVYAETCEYIDDDGVVTPGVRMVFIDADGVSYNTSSKGILNGITKIFTIFGMPNTWKSPLPVIIRQKSIAADKNVLIIECV